MKKYILFGFSLLTFTSFSQTQFELVVEGTVADVSGTAIEIMVPLDTEKSITFDAINASAASSRIVVQRVKLTDLGNSDYVCWGESLSQGTCYGIDQVTPNNPWNSAPEIIPSQTEGWFAAYYENTGNYGVDTYRYYLLDFDNNNAKVDSIDIIWNNGFLSLEENNNLAISVYPNPAQNQLNVNVGNNNGKLVMFDALGQKVLTSKVNGSAKVDVSSLNNGVYFYSFINTNGTATESKRLVVRK